MRQARGRFSLTEGAQGGQLSQAGGHAAAATQRERCQRAVRAGQAAVRSGAAGAAQHRQLLQALQRRRLQLQGQGWWEVSVSGGRGRLYSPPHVQPGDVPCVTQMIQSVTCGRQIETGPASG